MFQGKRNAQNCNFPEISAQNGGSTSDISFFQVTDFVERLMKHASNLEVLLFKKPLDARLHQLLAYTPELNLGSITDLEFISNFQAIQVQILLLL